MIANDSHETPGLPSSAEVDEVKAGAQQWARKPGQPVRAVKWTGSNWKEVHEVYPYLGEEYMRDKGCQIGFYVVSPRPGRVYFESAEAFEGVYGPTPAPAEEDDPAFEELKRLSAAATQSEWVKRTTPDGFTSIAFGPDRMHPAEMVWGKRCIASDLNADTATFIVAAVNYVRRQIAQTAATPETT